MSQNNVEEAAAILEKWDAGEHVWSVEMGGMGPGYEQAIQLTAFEILRYLVTERPDASEWRNDRKVWIEALKKIDAAVMPKVDNLGLSGAQWGAAIGIATRFYMDGPKAAVESAPQDRRIQVGRNFPELEATQ